MYPPPVVALVELVLKHSNDLTHRTTSNPLFNLEDKELFLSTVERMARQGKSHNIICEALARLVAETAETKVHEVAYDEETGSFKPLACVLKAKAEARANK